MIGRYFRAVPLVFAAGILFAACGHGSSAAENPNQSADTALRGGARAVVVDEKTRSTIKTAVLRDRVKADTLTIAGKVEFDEDRVAHVLAPLAGQIVDLRVKVGDVVKKGDPLCALSSRDVAVAVGEQIESHKDLDLAEKTLAMTQDLFDHQAASKIALQQAQNDLEKARSRVARNDETLRVLGLSAEASNAIGRVVLPSPLTGDVIERKVTEGQFVQSDSTPIMTIADLSTVWVMGDIFERDLHLAAVGRPAIVTVAAYPGEEFAGRVDYISDLIDPATRTAKVRIAVPNRGARLKIEMFASVSLGVGDTSEHVLTLPSAAAFIEGGETWVYVAAGANRFVRRLVSLSEDQNGERRVLAGLKPGDEVVVDGGLLLRQEEELGAS